MRSMGNFRTEIVVAIAMVVFTACTTDASDVKNNSDGLESKQSAVLAANPYEWNTAVAADSDPSADVLRNCIEMVGGKACFERHGDRWWVLDTDGDGHSATASWDNYLFDEDAGQSGGWRLWRSGSCVNKLGKGHWGVCNKDYYEWDSVNAYGDNGSILHWEACVYDSADGTWHGCSGAFMEIANDQ